MLQFVDNDFTIFYRESRKAISLLQIITLLCILVNMHSFFMFILLFLFTSNKIIFSCYTFHQYSG